MGSQKHDISAVASEYKQIYHKMYRQSSKGTMARIVGIITATPQTPTDQGSCNVGPHPPLPPSPAPGRGGIIGGVVVRSLRDRTTTPHVFPRPWQASGQRVGSKDVA